MDKQEYFDELRTKYELATSDVYTEIRKKALNYIVKCSNSSMPPERIQGMLLLVGEIDSWIDEYNRVIEKRKDN